MSINFQVRWADNTEQLKRNLAEGLDQIEVTRAAVDKLAKAMGGDNLLRAANNYAAALQKIGGEAGALGGIEKQTSAERERGNALLQKAVEKYQALGQAIPTAIKELADLTAKQVAAGKAADQLAKEEQRLIDAFSGTKSIASATALANAIEKVGGASKLTASEQTSVNKQITEAIAKYQALGQQAPKSLTDLAAATKQVDKPTQDLNASVGTLGVSFGKLVASYITAQAAIAAFKAGFETVVGVVTDSIKAASEAEDAHVKLVAALKAQGTAVPSVVSAFEGYASALQKTTVYQDDALEGAAALLVEVGNVMPRDMAKALKATTDLASGLGKDLNDAALLVSKAAEGNVNALKKAGVQFGDTKDRAVSFGEVLDKINEKFGGQAEAIAGTYQGRLKQLANTWNNVEESIGRVITQNQTVLDIIDAVNKSIDGNTGELKDNKALMNAVSDAAILLVKAFALGATGLEVFSGFIVTTSKEFIALERITYGMATATLTLAKALAINDPILRGFAEAGLAVVKKNAADVEKQLLAVGAGAANAGNLAGNLSKSANELADQLAKTRGQSHELAIATDENANAWTRSTKPIAVVTAAQKQFADAMAELNSVGASQEETLNGIGGAVVEAAKWYLEAGVNSGKLAIAFGLTDVQMKAIVTDFETTNKVMGDFKKKVAELEPVLKKAFELNVPIDFIQKQFGTAIQELVGQAEILGKKLPDAINQAFLKISVKDNTKQLQKDLGDIIELQAKAAKAHNEDWIKSIDYVDDAREKASDLYRKRTLSDTAYEIDAVKRRGDASVAAYVRIAKAAKLSDAEIEQGIKDVRKVTEEELAAIEKRSREALAGPTKAELATQIANAKQTYQDIKDSGQHSAQAVYQAWHKTYLLMHQDELKHSADLDQLFGGYAQLFQQLAQIAGESKFGTVAREIGETFGALQLANKASADLSEGMAAIGAGHTIEGWTQVGASIAGMIGAMDQATKGASRLGNAVKGALVGAKIGANPALVAATGGLSIAFGAAAGAIIGAFRKPEYAKVMSDVGRDWGIKLSDALAKKVAQIEVTEGVKRIQAVTIALKDVIAEAGGLNNTNINKFSDKLRDAFSFLERGELNLGQVTKILDDNFADFAKAGTTSLGFLSAKLVDVIKLNQRFGTQSKEIASYVTAQTADITSGFNAVADAIVGPFNRAVKNITDTGDALGDLYEKEDKLRAQIETLNKKDHLTPVQQAQLRSWSHQLEDVQQQIADLSTANRDAVKTTDDLGKTGQEAFDRIGRLAVVSFAAAQASGQGLLEAITAIGPGLDVLQKAMGSFGFEASGTLQELLAFRSVAENNKELIAGIDGLNKMMTGLNNTGRITEQSFDDIALTAVDMRGKLMAAGLTGDQSLRAMQPTLQRLWELQQKYNFTLGDAETQLIDEAKAMDLVGEKQKPLAEQQLDATLAVEKAIKDLERAIRGLPPAAQDAANGIERSFNGIHVKPVDVPFNAQYPDLPQVYEPAAPEGFASGSGGIRDFGTGTPAILHGREAVLTEAQLNALSMKAFASDSSARDTDRDLIVKVTIDPASLEQVSQAIAKIKPPALDVPTNVSDLNLTALTNGIEEAKKRLSVLQDAATQATDPRAKANADAAIKEQVDEVALLTKQYADAQAAVKRFYDEAKIQPPTLKPELRDLTPEEQARQNDHGIDPGFNVKRDLSQQFRDLFPDADWAALQEHFSGLQDILATQIPTAAADGSKLTEAQFDQMRKDLETQAEEARSAFVRQFGKLPDDAKTAADLISEALTLIRVPTVEIRYRYDTPNGPDTGGGVPPPGFATGSGGIRDFGAGTLAILHGKEAVITEEQLQNLKMQSVTSVKPDPVDIPVKLVMDAVALTHVTTTADRAFDGFPKAASYAVGEASKTFADFTIPAINVPVAFAVPDPPRITVPDISAPIRFDVPPTPDISIPIVQAPVRFDIPVFPVVTPPVTGAPVGWMIPPFPSITPPVSIVTVAFEIPVFPTIKPPVVHVPVVFDVPPMPKLPTPQFPTVPNPPSTTTPHPNPGPIGSGGSSSGGGTIGPIRSFAEGSRGFQDFGWGTLAVLHGREAVVTEAELADLRRQPAAVGAHGSEQRIVIELHPSDVNLDGELLTHMMWEHSHRGGEVKEAGVRFVANAIRDRRL